MICDNCALKGKGLIHCKINCPGGKELYEQAERRDRLCESSAVCKSSGELPTENKK